MQENKISRDTDTMEKERWLKRNETTVTNHEKRVQSSSCDITSEEAEKLFKALETEATFAFLFNEQ